MPVETPRVYNSVSNSGATAPLRSSSSNLDGSLRVDPGVGSIHQAQAAPGLLGSQIALLKARLGPQEFRRRMVHIAPGFLPFLLWPIPHEDPLSATLKGIMIALSIGIGSWAWLSHHRFARRGEKSLAGAVLGYAGVVLGMLVLIPSSPELGLAVMGIIAFGDGLATLAGLLVRGRALPWNPAKSWAGFVAFIAAAVPMATIIYWGEAQPGVSVSTALACAAPAALAAAIAESLPSRINDNIRVGVVSAVTIVLAHAMFVG